MQHPERERRATGFLNRRLARALSAAARLLPAERQEWAEAVQAEAGQVPPGLARLRWTAGGLWLVMREASLLRRFAYGLGVALVAAAAGWVAWQSWRASPATDPQTVTDRVRVGVGLIALTLLPWTGRRQGWFGPVARNSTARLVRLGGCLALCSLGASVVRMDSHLGLGPHGPGPFSLPREIAMAALAGATVATLAMIRSRRPDADVSTLLTVAAMAGVVVFVVLPLQAIALGYAAGVLAATSRRSPIATRSLALAIIGGAVATAGVGLFIYAGSFSDNYFLLALFAVLAFVFIVSGLAGGAAARLAGDNAGDAAQLRTTRIRQGLLTGLAAGALTGLLLTALFPGVVMLMIFGPIAGFGGGALGGALAADHLGSGRRDGSRAGGLSLLARGRA